MKYEAFYSAVLSAVPTVLIGFVLEVRLLLKHARWKNPKGYARRFTSLTIMATGLSGILSLFVFMVPRKWGLE
jgi:hypothetical protein